MNFMCQLDVSKILLGCDPQKLFFTKRRVDRSVNSEKEEAARQEMIVLQPCTKSMCERGQCGKTFSYSSFQQNIRYKVSSRDFTPCGKQRLYNLPSLQLLSILISLLFSDASQGVTRIQNKAGCFYHMNSNQKCLPLLSVILYTQIHYTKQEMEETGLSKVSFIPTHERFLRESVKTSKGNS